MWLSRFPHLPQLSPPPPHLLLFFTFTPGLIHSGPADTKKKVLKCNRLKRLWQDVMLLSPPRTEAPCAAARLHFFTRRSDDYLSVRLRFFEWQWLGKDKVINRMSGQQKMRMKKIGLENSTHCWGVWLIPDWGSSRRVIAKLPYSSSPPSAKNPPRYIGHGTERESGAGSVSRPQMKEEVAERLMGSQMLNSQPQAFHLENISFPATWGTRGTMLQFFYRRNTWME